MDGKLIVVGGRDSQGTRLRSAELYDPTTRTWTWLEDMRQPRYGCVAAEVGGQLLVAGGHGGGTYHSSAEIYAGGNENEAHTRSTATPSSDNEQSASAEAANTSLAGLENRVRTARAAHQQVVARAFAASTKAANARLHYWFACLCPGDESTDQMADQHGTGDSELATRCRALRQLMQHTAKLSAAAFSAKKVHLQSQASVSLLLRFISTLERLVTVVDETATSVATAQDGVVRSKETLSRLRQSLQKARDWVAEVV